MNKYLLALFVVLMPACTTLNVKVEIFNPSGITSDQALESTVKRESANHSYLLKTDYYSQVAIDLTTQVSEFLDFLASLQCPDESKSKVIATGDLPQLKSAAKTNIETAVADAVRARNEGLALLREAETATKDNRTTTMSAALQKFSVATRQLSELSVKSQQLFDQYTKHLAKCITEKPPTPLNQGILNKAIAKQRQVQSSIEQKVVSLTGGADLLDDPLAPIVIASPDEFWRGVYNETSALGTMGNTDIAIKMETVGSFTIKGVRVDASKVTEATFDVLKQSIRMVAAAYGIPLPASEKKSSPDSMGSPTDIVMTADDARQMAERKRLLSRTAALTLLDLIAAERSHLAAAITRTAAIQNLKKSFAAYKGQLSGD